MNKEMICRTCLRDVQSEKCLKFPTNESKQTQIFERINLCIPEMDLFLAAEPVLCFECMDALERAFHFRKTCLRIEEEIINYLCSDENMARDESEKIDLRSFKMYFESDKKSIANPSHILKSEIKVEIVDDNHNNGNLSNAQLYSDEGNCGNDEDEIKDIKPAIMHLEDKTNIQQNCENIVEAVPPKKSSKQRNIFKCDKCTGCTHRSRNPTLHKRSEDGIFICDHCKNIYRSIDEIKKHIYKHTKPIVCNVCNKRSRDLQQHKTHLRSHTDVKAFQCEFCQKGFKQKFALTQHRRIHDPNSWFKCEYCSKVCSTKYNLKVHMSGHTGKQFQCSRCGKKYLTNSSLQLHKKKVCQLFSDEEEEAVIVIVE